MTRLTSFGILLCTTMAVVWALGGGASAAEPLRLVTDVSLGSADNIRNSKTPGFNVDVLRQVFAAMGQDVSFEGFPPNRAWTMILRGERDGMINAVRTGEHDGICSYPDEPLSRDRWVFFVRMADIGKLNFSSFDDLVGHDVAVREPVPGLMDPVPPALAKFLHAHHDIVKTTGSDESLRMLAAGRVDYAVENLRLGMREIASTGLSGKIAPLLSHSLFEANVYVCFTKSRVAPSFVDAFSRALKQFKQTKAFQATYDKYLKNFDPVSSTPSSGR